MRISFNRTVIHQCRWDGAAEWKVLPLHYILLLIGVLEWSAGVEVLSDGMALQTDSDEEMLAASTSPHTTNTPTKDSMPNVRSLAEALQEPMEPVALKVRHLLF